MNNTQLFAVAIPFVIMLGALVAGAWLNQRGLERQMDAFRNEIKAEIGAFKIEIRSELKTELAPLRADVEQVKKTVEKIDRQLEAIVSRLILPK